MSDSSAPIDPATPAGSEARERLSLRRWQPHESRDPRRDPQKHDRIAEFHVFWREKFPGGEVGFMDLNEKVAKMRRCSLCEWQAYFMASFPINSIFVEDDRDTSPAVMPDTAKEEERR